MCDDFQFDPSPSSDVHLCAWCGMFIEMNQEPLDYAIVHLPEMDEHVYMHQQCGEIWHADLTKMQSDTGSDAK